MQLSFLTTTQSNVDGVLDPSQVNSQFAAVIVMVTIFSIAVIILLLVAFNIHKTKKMMESCQVKMKEQNEEYTRNIELQNQKFVLEVVKSLTVQQEKLLAKVSAPHENRNLLNTFMKLRESLIGNCTKTMQSINASRIAIYLFHNGTRSTHGIDFFKMSCICEEIKPGSGIREKLIEHSSVQINLFDTMVDKLITNGRYLIMNDEEQQYSSHRMFLSTKAVAYAQLVAIFDHSNNILGFVCAEMMHEYDRENAMKEKTDLEDLIVQIVPVLSYSEYIDTTIDETKEKQETINGINSSHDK